MSSTLKPSASLVLVAGKKLLLLKRSKRVWYPGTWGVAGGSLEKHEAPITGALREADEEIGALPPLRMVAKCRQGTHTAFIAEVRKPFKPKLNWEHDTYRWVTVAQAHRAGLHPELRRLFEEPVACKAFKP